MHHHHHRQGGGEDEEGVVELIFGAPEDVLMVEIQSSTSTTTAAAAAVLRECYVSSDTDVVDDKDDGSERLRLAMETLGLEPGTTGLQVSTGPTAVAHALGFERGCEQQQQQQELDLDLGLKGELWQKLMKEVELFEPWTMSPGLSSGVSL